MCISSSFFVFNVDFFRFSFPISVVPFRCFCSNIISDLVDFDDVDSAEKSENSAIQKNPTNFVRRNAWMRTSLRRSPAKYEIKKPQLSRSNNVQITEKLLGLER